MPVHDGQRTGCRLSALDHMPSDKKGLGTVNKWVRRSLETAILTAGFVAVGAGAAHAADATAPTDAAGTLTDVAHAAPIQLPSTTNVTSLVSSSTQQVTQTASRTVHVLTQQGGKATPGQALQIAHNQSAVDAAKAAAKKAAAAAYQARHSAQAAAALQQPTLHITTDAGHYGVHGQAGPAVGGGDLVAPGLPALQQPALPGVPDLGGLPSLPGTPDLGSLPSCCRTSVRCRPLPRCRACRARVLSRARRPCRVCRVWVRCRRLRRCPLWGSCPACPACRVRVCCRVRRPCRAPPPRRPCRGCRVWTACRA